MRSILGLMLTKVSAWVWVCPASTESLDGCWVRLVCTVSQQYWPPATSASRVSTSAPPKPATALSATVRKLSDSSVATSCPDNSTEGVRLEGLSVVYLKRPPEGSAEEKNGPRPAMTASVFIRAAREPKTPKTPPIAAPADAPCSPAARYPTPARISPRSNDTTKTAMAVSTAHLACRLEAVMDPSQEQYLLGRA
jgi:hypothetical protein